MKHLFFSILFVTLFAVNCGAQWKGNTVNDKRIAYGVHDTDLYSSYTGGITAVIHYSYNTGWTEADAGIDFSQGSVTSFATLGKYFFAGLTYSNGANGRVYSLFNVGSNWEALNVAGPIASNGIYLFGSLLSSYGNHPQYLCRSGDAGQNWDSLLTLPVAAISSIGHHILVISNALWRSSDTGTHWSQVSYPLGLPDAFAVIDTMIFAGSSTGQKGIACSKDSGGTWTSIGFPHAVTALVTDGKNLWVGTIDSGVYISTDMGQHWRNVSDGLKYFLQVTAMAVYDTMMIVATVSPGSQNYYEAWRPISEMVDTPPSSVVQTQSIDSLSIYPNPALGVVTIFSGGTSIYGVSVLNVLGENVLDMPNLWESDITLDLSKLPSGTYFLQIETANGTVLRKVVIQH